MLPRAISGTTANDRAPRETSGKGALAKQIRKPPSFKTGQQIVYVKVGAEQKSFGVHQELICFHSPYFRAAFKGGFQEATTGEVLLDDVDSEVFGLFVQWLYTQAIVESTCFDEPSTSLEKAGPELPLTRYLIELWLLAEYLQVPILQNHVLGVIMDRTSRRNLSHIDSFDIAYERTARGSKLRRFFVDLVCWSSASGQWILRNRKWFPSEMILDILVVERDRRFAFNDVNPLKDMSNYDADDSTKGGAD